MANVALVKYEQDLKDLFDLYDRKAMTLDQMQAACVNAGLHERGMDLQNIYFGSLFEVTERMANCNVHVVGLELNQSSDMADMEEHLPDVLWHLCKRGLRKLSLLAPFYDVNNMRRFCTTIRSAGYMQTLTSFSFQQNGYLYGKEVEILEAITVALPSLTRLGILDVQHGLIDERRVSIKYMTALAAVVRNRNRTMQSLYLTCRGKLMGPLSADLFQRMLQDGTYYPAMTQLKLPFNHLKMNPEALSYCAQLIFSMPNLQELDLQAWTYPRVFLHRNDFGTIRDFFKTIGDLRHLRVFDYSGCDLSLSHGMCGLLAQAVLHGACCHTLQRLLLRNCKLDEMLQRPENSDRTRNFWATARASPLVIEDERWAPGHDHSLSEERAWNAEHRV